MGNSKSDQYPHQLHIFVLPFLAPGHMIPMIDIARIIAVTDHSVKVTIITTTHNALLFKNSIDADINAGHNINLHILQFPSAQVGLPEGIENFNAVTSPDMSSKIYQAIGILQQSMEQLLRESHPDCIVADMFYPWTTDLANELGCPRIVFQGTSFFSLSVKDGIRKFYNNDANNNNNDDDDNAIFIVPGLPDHIELKKSELPGHYRTKNLYSNLLDVMKEAERRSYGVIVNSFYELEPSYVDHYRNVIGTRKAWHIGPVSRWINRSSSSEEEEEEEEVGINGDHRLIFSWLDSMKPQSVLYVCFGSLSKFPKAQQVEIKCGLEAFGHPYIWVVKEKEFVVDDDDDDNEKMKKMKIKIKNKVGMIIRGWAPQVAILEHPAVGGFVTHCGWNSVLESVAAGVPMIAWPLYAEQFCNEKLITKVLKIGVGIGVDEWNSLPPAGSSSAESVAPSLNRERFVEVVIRLMNPASSGDDHESEEIRKRAKELSQMAKSAVQDGGSSYTSLCALIDDLKRLRLLAAV